MSIEFDFNEQKNVCTHTHTLRIYRKYSLVLSKQWSLVKKYYTVIYDEKMVSGIKGVGRDWSWWGCPSKKKAAFFCSVKMVIEQGGGKRKCSRNYYYFFFLVLPSFKHFILEIKCLESRAKKVKMITGARRGKNVFTKFFFSFSSH